MVDRSKACQIVEAATNMWRYSPYEREREQHSRRLSANSPGIPLHLNKSFIKSERMSPKLGSTSVSTKTYRICVIRTPGFNSNLAEICPIFANF